VPTAPSSWHGRYLEVDAPRRLVSTEVFGDAVDEAQNILLTGATPSPSCR
jgi:uncharacterized protein YndB with AHSA1/START domain